MIQLSKTSYIVAVLWTAVVFGAYWLFHYAPLVIGIALAATALALLFIFGMRRLHLQGRYTTALWKLLLFGWLGVWLMVLCAIFALGAYETASRAVLWSFWYVFQYGAFVGVFLLLATALGRFVMRRVVSRDAMPFFVHTGIGVLVMVYSALLLGVAHLFSVPTAALFVLVVCVCCYKDIVFYTKKIANTHVTYVYDTQSIEGVIRSIMPLGVYVYGALLLFLGLRAIALIADDAAVYLRVPLQFAARGGIVPFYDGFTAASYGGFSYAMALLTSIVPTYLLMIFSPLFLLLTVYVVYRIGLFWENKNVARLAALAVLITPWNIYFAFTSKVIMLFSFVSVLALWALLNFVQKKDHAYLYLAAFFAGASVMIKFNGIFLVIACGCALLWILWRRMVGMRVSIIALIIAGAAFLPQGIVNTYLYHDPLVNAPYRYEKDDTLFDSGERVYLIDIMRHSELRVLRASEYLAMQRQNNTFTNPAVNALWSVWNSTVHQRGYNLLYVDIGFMALALLPFLVFVFFTKRTLHRREMMLSIIGGVGVFIWFVFGKESAWYGIAFWYVLWLLIASALADVDAKQKYVYYIAYVLQAVIACMLAVSSLQPAQLHWLAGDISQHALAQEGQWPDMTARMNDEIARGELERVLMIPEQRGLYISDNDTRVIGDSLGHYWSQVVYETGGDFDAMTHVFVQQQITHIVLSHASEQWLRQFASKEALQSYALFQYFDIVHAYVAARAVEEYCNDSACLYRIMQP